MCGCKQQINLTSSSLSNNNLSPSLLTLSNSLDKSATTVFELIRGLVGVLNRDETLFARLVRSDDADDVEDADEGCLEWVERGGAGSRIGVNRSLCAVEGRNLTT